MSANGSNGFEFSEARFAVHVGLSRDDAKLLRRQHLAEGEDWAKKHGEIALSRGALKKLWRVLRNAPSTLNLSACALEPLAKKDAAAAALLALPEAVTFERPARLKVKRIYDNTRVLLATDQAQRDWTVIVGKSEHFVLGMELPAVPSTAHPGYYQLVGKLPRSRGRWT